MSQVNITGNYNPRLLHQRTFSGIEICTQKFFVGLTNFSGLLSQIKCRFLPASSNQMSTPIAGPVAEGRLSCITSSSFRASSTQKLSHCYGVEVASIEINQTLITFNISQSQFLEQLASTDPEDTDNTFTGELRNLFREFGSNEMRFVAAPLSRTSLQQNMQIKLIRNFQTAGQNGIYKANQAGFLDHRTGIDKLDTANQMTSDGRKKRNIAVFSNIGGDAILICPKKPSLHGFDDTPKSLISKRDYVNAHQNIGTFAMSKQISPQKWNRLWSNVGRELAVLLKGSSDPVHLNTDGRGVAWLHIRLDSTDKYVAGIF